MKFSDSEELETCEHIAVIKPCQKMGWHISMLLHLVYIYLNIQFTHDETALSEKKCKCL